MAERDGGLLVVVRPVVHPEELVPVGDDRRVGERLVGDQPLAVEDARGPHVGAHAGVAGEVADLLRLHHEVVLGGGGVALEDDQVLLVERAAHPHRERADPLHLEEVRGQLPAEPDELGELPDPVREGVARKGSLVDEGVRLAQRESVVPLEPGADPRDQLRPARPSPPPRSPVR